MGESVVFVCSCGCAADSARNNSATEDPENEQAQLKQFRLFGDGELIILCLWFRKAFSGGQQYRSVAWAVILL